MATHDVHGGFAKSSDGKGKRKGKPTPTARRQPSQRVRQGSDLSKGVADGKIVPTARMALDQGTASSVSDFDDEGDVIAGVVPVPRGVAPSIRDALATALVERFGYPEDLDEWLHTPHCRLAGATPFERLVAGTALAVYEALVGDVAEHSGRVGRHR